MIIRKIIMSISAFIRLTRPLHIIKNISVFLPAFFYGVITERRLFHNLVPTFIAFYIASCIVYILNDIFDRKEDALHPLKKTRPLASGKITVRSALIMIIFLSILLLLFCIISLRAGINVLILFYIILNILYSSFFKKVIILDAIIVSAGFILRIVAGFVSIGYNTNYYLVIWIFLLAIIIALAKRIRRFPQTDRDTSETTIVEQTYTILSPIVVIVYYLFVSSLKSPYLLISTVLLQIGLIRFVYYLFYENDYHSPFEILFLDRKMQTIILSYIIFMLFFIYLID
jgi:decaprenyl-phosphate phosphoribosyltransferase